MPVITLELEDVEKLTGVSRQKLLDRIPMLGADIERVEERYVDVEFFPNRPDLYSPEGVARALRGFLGIERGIPTYSVAPPRISIQKDESVKRVRPNIVCGVVRNVQFTDSSIRSLMELQEDLHWALGRDRKKVSIGVHDLSRVSPPFRYTTAPPDFEFIPLGFDEPMSIERILKEHPKGIKYAHILENAERYPLIVDSMGEVLSFPPIINGTLTMVTEDSTDLFVDVTGTDDTVLVALNILLTSLGERGATLEGVNVVEPHGASSITPELAPTTISLSLKEVYSLIGINISLDDVVEALEKMRYGVQVTEGRVEKGREAGHTSTTQEHSEDTMLIVEVPAYRADILHPWDIIEDIAIGYGYDRITPDVPNIFTIGKPHPVSVMRRTLREIMVGLGFLETMSFSLTSERVHYEYMRREPSEKVTHVLHPITQEHTMVCSTLLPNLIEILSLNRHREMPQRLFVVGDVVVDDCNRTHLALLSCHPSANFTEVKSYALSIAREIATELSLKTSNDLAFIEGRQASLFFDGKEVGVMGEVHPEVLVNFSLDVPVVALEIELPEDWFL
ncbi:MAG: phenylalanine--tRNA ligase subunit beta [Methermicoccaceae archaeon]